MVFLLAVIFRKITHPQLIWSSTLTSQWTPPLRHQQSPHDPRPRPRVLLGSQRARVPSLRGTTAGGITLKTH